MTWSGPAGWGLVLIPAEVQPCSHGPPGVDGGAQSAFSGTTVGVGLMHVLAWDWSFHPGLTESLKWIWHGF